MKFPIVRARWKDAYGKQDEYESDKIAALHPYAEVFTVGYLVRKTREAIYIAQDWLPGSESEPATWRGFTIVPRGMLIEMTTLRPGSQVN